MNFATKALGRLPVGVMNKTEQAYADHLEMQRRAGVVRYWKFEAVKFRLADLTTYTPDFLVMLEDRSIELHEVKGFWMDDARLKIKVAAEQYPFFSFVGIKAIAKKRGGGWEEERF